MTKSQGYFIMMLLSFILQDTSTSNGYLITALFAFIFASVSAILAIRYIFIKE